MLISFRANTFESPSSLFFEPLPVHRDTTLLTDFTTNPETPLAWQKHKKARTQQGFIYPPPPPPWAPAQLPPQLEY